MQKPEIKTGGKQVYLYQLEQIDELTEWEQLYRVVRPNHFYVIWSNWSKEVRDFVAYIKVMQKDEFDEAGTSRTNKYRTLTRWYDSVVRGIIDHEGWEWYIDNPRTMNPERWAAKQNFEAIPIEERAQMQAQSYASTRKAADGTVINDRGEVVGRWDDNEDGIRQWAISHGEDPDYAVRVWRDNPNFQNIPPGSNSNQIENEKNSDQVSDQSQTEYILNQVITWSQETHHGQAHCTRWKEAANGMKPGTFPGFGTMTSAEAKIYENKYLYARWHPVRVQIEQAQQQRDQAQEVPEEDDSKTLFEKHPDGFYYEPTTRQITGWWQKLPEHEREAIAKDWHDRQRSSSTDDGLDVSGQQNEESVAVKRPLRQLKAPLQKKQKTGDVRLPEGTPSEMASALQNGEWLRVAAFAQRQHEKENEGKSK